MDGYAVVAADTFGASTARAEGADVRRIASSRARCRRAAIAAGECIEIATGAPMPPGADAVVMVEETERASGGTAVRVLTPVYPRQHVGRRGGGHRDRARSWSRAGQVLNPSRIGALAATGVTDVEVFAQAVGRDSLDRQRDRRARPAARARPDLRHQPLHARGDRRRHGGVAAPLPIAADSIEELSSALDAAPAHDVVVFSGGSSVGERDLILDVLRDAARCTFTASR